jgi:hypothetical protein
MNWKNLFIAGLILSLSPLDFRFQNSSSQYVLMYSILGYGLLFLSLFLKNKKPPDYGVIIICGAIIVSALLNQFFLVFLLQTLFFLAILSFYLAESGINWVRQTSAVLSGILGIMTAIEIGTILGYPLPYISELAGYFPTAYLVIITILFIISYRKIPD